MFHYLDPIKNKKRMPFLKFSSTPLKHLVHASDCVHRDMKHAGSLGA